MEKRKLGKTDMEVTVVTLGAWNFAKKMWTGADDENSIKTVHAALDSGINIIDTASGYGESEELVGKALKNGREKVLLATKISATSPDKIRQALEDSLRKLNTDCIDLYYIHYPSPKIPVAETLKVYDGFRKEGKIRAIGVSNFSLQQMKEGLEAVRYDACQPPYNIFWRQPETEGIVDFCIQNNISIFPYSSLAQGLLTGKYRSREGMPKDIRSQNKLFAEGVFEKCINVVELMDKIAKKYEKNVTQVAVNWTINRPGITSAIVGARRAEQVLDTVKSAGWKLNDDDIEELSRRGMEISKTLDFSSNMWGYAPK